MLFCNEFHSVRHISDCMLEHEPAFLIDNPSTWIVRLLDLSVSSTAISHMKRVVMAVRPEIAVDESIILSRSLHHDASSSISENRACGAVLVIGDSRKEVSSTENDSFESSAGNHACTHLHGIKESGTSRLHIKSESVFESHITDNKRCSRRKDVVRSRSGTNNSFNRVRVDLRFLKQFLYSLGHHI